MRDHEICRAGSCGDGDCDRPRAGAAGKRHKSPPSLHTRQGGTGRRPQPGRLPFQDGDSLDFEGRQPIIDPVQRSDSARDAVPRTTTRARRGIADWLPSGQRVERLVNFRDRRDFSLDFNRFSLFPIDDSRRKPGR